MKHTITAGRPWPLGASWDGTGVNFASLTIASGAAVNMSVDVRVRQTLTVDGAFTTTAVLDADGPVSFSATSTVDLGAATHTFARDYTDDATALASGQGN